MQDGGAVDGAFGACAPALYGNARPNGFGSDRRKVVWRLTDWKPVEAGVAGDCKECVFYVVFDSIANVIPNDCEDDPTGGIVPDDGEHFPSKGHPRLGGNLEHGGLSWIQAEV